MTARAIIVFLSAFLVASCAPPAPPADENPLRPGLRITVKAFGELYMAEVTEVHGGYSKWKMMWEDRIVSVFKVYRGIFPVSGSEEKSYYHNQVDLAPLDQLFPLEVGKEVSLSGSYENSSVEGGGSLWAHIVVQEETEISIKGRVVPVFLIEVSIERKGAAGSQWDNRTLWYSPELGFSLKTRYQRGEEKFTVRVLSIEVPGEDANPPSRRNLGTVVI